MFFYLFSSSFQQIAKIGQLLILFIQFQDLSHSFYSNFDFVQGPVEWHTTFIAFSFVIEGTSKKVLQFLMTLELICKKNFFWMNKVFIMNTTIRFKQKTIFKITITLLFFKKCSVNLFRAALYKLSFVTHEDPLFH